MHACLYMLGPAVAVCCNGVVLCLLKSSARTLVCIKTGQTNLLYSVSCVDQVNISYGF